MSEREEKTLLSKRVIKSIAIDMNCRSFQALDLILLGDKIALDLSKIAHTKYK